MSIHHNTYINRTDHPVSKQRSAETEKPSSPRTPRFSVRPIFEDISCCRRRAQRLRPNGSGKTFMSARRPNVICPGRWPCSLAPPQAQLARTLAKMRLATLQRLVQPVDRRAFAHARLTDHFKNAAQVGGRIGSASVDLSSDSFELEERDGAHFGWAARCC